MVSNTIFSEKNTKTKHIRLFFFNVKKKNKMDRINPVGYVTLTMFFEFLLGILGIVSSSAAIYYAHNAEPKNTTVLVFSGAFLCILLIGCIWWGITYSKRTNKKLEKEQKKMKDSIFDDIDNEDP